MVPARLSVSIYFLIGDWNGRLRGLDDEHTDLRWFAPKGAARLPNLALTEYRHVFAGPARWT